MRDPNSTLDKVQQGQLVWSCMVALGLGIAALVHWGTPRNSLLEPDRAPAQIRGEVVAEPAMRGAALVQRR